MSNKMKRERERERKLQRINSRANWRAILEPLGRLTGHFQLQTGQQLDNESPFSLSISRSFFLVSPLGSLFRLTQIRAALKARGASGQTGHIVTLDGVSGSASLLLLPACRSYTLCLLYLLKPN